jgi:hypothetical protein
MVSRALDLDFNLMGAPNFRAASTQLKVYATAQPKLNGLRTILSILSCFPHAPTPQKAVWVSTREEPQLYIGGRPFVLRDCEKPLEGIALTDRGSQLEEIEERLKRDVLKEGKQYGGCVLVHEELDNGRLVANWVAADEIRTPLELFGLVKAEGYLVDYHRIPIAHEQDPESNYLDAYAQLITSTPIESTLIFNCGSAFALWVCAGLSESSGIRAEHLCVLRCLDSPTSEHITPYGAAAETVAAPEDAGRRQRPLLERRAGKEEVALAHQSACRARLC